MSADKPVGDPGSLAMLQRRIGEAARRVGVLPDADSAVAWANDYMDRLSRLNS